MKVSIITATCNSEETIADAIDSVNEQDYYNIQHIIVDGASTDRTLEITAKMKLKNPNIFCMSEKDEGIYDALNKGLNLATGDIIGFVHSDDFLATSYVISDIVNHFKNGNFSGVYGNLLYVDREDTNKVIRKWYSKTFHTKLLQLGWMPAHPTLFLKKQVYSECGNFNESFKITADYDLMLRVLKKSNYTFGFLPKVVTKMRVGGKSNKSISNMLIKSKEDLKVMKCNELKNPFVALFFKNISKLTQFI